MEKSEHETQQDMNQIQKKKKKKTDTRTTQTGDDHDNLHKINVNFKPFLFYLSTLHTLQWVQSITEKVYMKRALV